MTLKASYMTKLNEFNSYIKLASFFFLFSGFFGWTISSLVESAPKEEPVKEIADFQNITMCAPISRFKIDMVDIFRKADVISLVVDAALERGDVKCVWTQLGLVNNEAAKKATDAGLKVVQNHCTKIEHANLI